MRGAVQFAGLLLLAAVSTASRAEEPSSLSVSGFGSLGVVSQSGAEGWRFLRNIAQSPADGQTSVVPDSRLGLQLNWSPGTTWEGALQAVAVKKSSRASASSSIEWAYLGWRPANTYRVRLGRFNPDQFLFSDSRSVGYAQLWVRPPVDFYGFVPVSSVDGVNVERRWASGQSQWHATMAAGRMSTTITQVTGQAYDATGKDLFFLGLTREHDGLLLKGTYFRGRVKPEAGPELALARAGLQQLAALPVPGLASSLAGLQRNLWSGGEVSYLGLALNYERGPWTLTSEGSVLSIPNSAGDAQRGYVSLGYRVGPVTYFGLASRVMPRRLSAPVPDLLSALTPFVGPLQAAGVQQLVNSVGEVGLRVRYDQSTVGAGFRWDVLPNAALKLQVDRFTVHPNGAAGWVMGNAAGTSGTLYSVVFDFVWGQ